MSRRGPWVVLAALATGVAVHQSASRGAGASAGTRDPEAGTEAAPPDLDCPGPEPTILSHLLARGPQEPNDAAPAGGGETRFPVPPPYERREVLIATVPDPLASRLDTSFDLMVGAVGMAVERDGFSLDRYWLPWKLDAKPGKERDQVERCYRTRPGVILFTKHGPTRPECAATDPAWCGVTTLAVLLVGEVATAGVHPEALRRAAQVALSFASGTGTTAEAPLRVLGPTFSGSADSLVRVLRGRRSTTSEPSKPDGWAPPRYVEFVSGTATSDGIVKLLNAPSPGPAGTPGRFRFRRTVNGDCALRARMDEYLSSLDVPRDRVVLLAESNTYYAAALPDDGPGPCKEVSWNTIRFPLHVSDVRRAFDRGRPTAAPTVGGYELPRTRLGLQRDAAPPASEELPTASPLTDNYEEMVLSSELRTACRGGALAIGIMATDARDKRFLVTKIRELCPRALPFTFESDILFAYPEEQAAFSGTVIASTYPLFAEVRTWGGQPRSPRRGLEGIPLLQFGDSSGTGAYNATLFHLIEMHGEDRGRDVLLDYRCPGTSHEQLLQQPPVWISVAARSDLLPLDVTCARGSMEAAGAASEPPRAAHPPDDGSPVATASATAATTPSASAAPQRDGAETGTPCPFRPSSLLMLGFLLAMHVAWLTARSRIVATAEQRGLHAWLAVHLAFAAAVLLAVVAVSRVAIAAACHPLFTWPFPFLPACAPPTPRLLVIQAAIALSGGAALAKAARAARVERAIERGVRVVRPRTRRAAAAVIVAAAAFHLVANGIAFSIAHGPVDRFLVAMRAGHLMSGMSPMVPLLLLALAVHAALYYHVRRLVLLDARIGSPAWPLFSALFWRASAQARGRCPVSLDEWERGLVAATRGGPPRGARAWTVIALGGLLLFFGAGRGASHDGTWFKVASLIGIGCATAAIVRSGVRAIRVWQPLREVLRYASGRHAMGAALRALAKTGDMARFAHFVSMQPTAQQLETSTTLLRDIEGIGDAPDDAVLADAVSHAKAHGSNPWRTLVYRLCQDYAEERVAPTCGARALEQASGSHAPRPEHLFLAQQFTLNVAWVVSHLRLLLASTVVASACLTLASLAYSYEFVPGLSLFLWLPLVAAAALGAYLVLDFERTDVARWMAGDRAGVDWNVVSQVAAVIALPIAALLLSRFPDAASSIVRALEPLFGIMGGVMQ